jgi:hypothetical protein
MGRSRYQIYETTHPHFFTCTILNWLPVFSLTFIGDDGNEKQSSACGFHIVNSNVILNKEIKIEKDNINHISIIYTFRM